MTKKAERGSQKRESILDAATIAFRDEGFEATSMDRISELAGASKRTVYNYFRNKEALFQEVLNRLMDRLVALKEIHWDPQRPLEDQLAAFAHAKAGMLDNPAWLDLLRVVLGVFIRSPELARQTMARGSRGEDRLQRWLRDAHAAGRLHVPDPELAAELFWAMASGALFWPQVFEGPMQPEQRERITRELVATFLCRFQRR
jgi:TetR/AcrR family transcriptional regulator of autoinduction and epiphytic fitness